jgi:hypothetical protein
MKKVLSGVLLLGMVVTPALASNVPSGHVPGTDHVLSGDELGAGMAMLYAPSEADDPTFRANIAAAMGGTVDYFDASGATPTVDMLMDYDCVMVWANFAFADPEGYGDNLAEFVDLGGTVIMGAFTVYTSGNSLGGAVVTPAYCPVVGGSNNFFFDTYAGDGTSCITDNAAGAGATYRDILSTQGAGVVNGTFNDGEVFVAYNEPDFTPLVIYVNGSGGSPIDGNNAGMVAAVADACACTSGPVPVVETSWGAIKADF